ncbi:MAG: hypothetical protein ACRCZH_03905 [Cetobacterium sp.]
MKKILILSSLLLALGACKNREIKKEESNIKVLKIEEKGTFSIVNVLGNQATTKDLKTDLKIEDNLLKINVKNISESVVVIQWNKARYIGLDKEEQKIHDLKNKESGIFQSEVVTLRPGQEYNGEFVPVKNLKFISQSQSNKEVVYGRKNLFNADEKEKQKRDYAEIVVPITVEGINGITQTFSFYIGQGDSKLLMNNLENEINSKKKTLIKNQPTVAPTKSAVLPPMPEVSHETTTKLQQVQEDNTKLKAEIEAREKLLQYLKEQEILKKQLAEKEAEIQKLLKTTTP